MNLFSEAQEKGMLNAFHKKLDTFRRDQVYFTEKNNKTGVSDLYSLDEFPVRKTDNIEKGYLLGRYGAIPYIRGEEL